MDRFEMRVCVPIGPSPTWMDGLEGLLSDLHDALVRAGAGFTGDDEEEPAMYVITLYCVDVEGAIRVVREVLRSHEAPVPSEVVVTPISNTFVPTGPSRNVAVS